MNTFIISLICTFWVISIVMFIRFSYKIYVYSRYGLHGNRKKRELVTRILTSKCSDFKLVYDIDSSKCYSIDIEAETYNIVIWEDMSVSIHKNGGCIYCGGGTYYKSNVIPKFLNDIANYGGK